MLRHFRLTIKENSKRSQKYLPWIYSPTITHQSKEREKGPAAYPNTLRYYITIPYNLLSSTCKYTWMENIWKNLGNHRYTRTSNMLLFLQNLNPLESYSNIYINFFEKITKIFFEHTKDFRQKCAQSTDLDDYIIFLIFYFPKI